MREQFTPKKFGSRSYQIIMRSNAILEEYDAQGFDMTLRQLYYQMIARDLFPESWIDERYNAKNNLPLDTKNTLKNYKNFGNIINDARLAGLLDWDHIVDRTRNIVSPPHWTSPESIIEAVADQYAIDKWEGQEYRPEVWIEKEALSGVFERICFNLDIPMFACRGYTSQSEMYSASQRFAQYERNDQKPFILHFGDHDPSGIDMTRDIADRLSIFQMDIEVDRLALNFDQVKQYKPPPNPAKVTDSRAAVYIRKYGRQSWELDALQPDVLAKLVEDQIESIIDRKVWDARVAEETEQKVVLRQISDRFEDVEKFLNKPGKRK